MKQKHSTRLLTWALIAALPLWFGSCKKNADVVSPATVEGSWRISAYKVDPGIDPFQTGQKNTDLLAIFRSLPGGVGNEIVDCLTTTVVTFSSDGKVASKPGPKCTTSTDMNPVDANSTWKLDGNKLTLTSSTDTTVYDTAISGNTFTMTTTQMEDFGDGQKNYKLTIELTKA